MPGAEAGAARTCTSEGASGSIPSRWRRSTTLTDPARGGPGADERGREDSEDRSEAAMAAELALGRSGAVAIPTRQRASSRWGTGEGRWIGGPNGIKSPAAAPPWGRRAWTHAAGLCRIRAKPSPRNGVLGAESPGERVGPHALGPEGKTFPSVKRMQQGRCRDAIFNDCSDMLLT